MQILSQLWEREAVEFAPAGFFVSSGWQPLQPPHRAPQNHALHAELMWVLLWLCISLLIGLVLASKISSLL